MIVRRFALLAEAARCLAVRRTAQHGLFSLLAALAVAGALNAQRQYAVAAEPAKTKLAHSVDSHTPVVDKLVAEALVAASQGNLAQRDELVAQALRAAPKNQSAHWAAGHVRLGNKWLPVPAAERTAAADPRWSEYHRLYDRVDDIESAEQLAEWCGRNGFDAQARWHWRQILTINPQHSRAQRELGLVYHQGLLMTRSERATVVQEQERWRRALRHWKATLNRWQRDLDHGNSAEREKALTEIAAVTDLDVVLALPGDPAAMPDEQGSADLCCALIRALARSRDSQVVSWIVRQGVGSPWKEVRQAAGEALAGREVTAFVPEVMVFMNPPSERVSTITTDDLGRVLYEQRLRRPGPWGEEEHVDQYSLSPSHLKITGNIKWTWKPERDAAVRLLKEKDQQDGAAVGEQNERQRVYNENALALLAATISAATIGEVADGVAPADIPGWWEWWRKFNELAGPTIGEGAPTYSYQHGEVFVPCCFAPGTCVATPTGLVPIETIRAGDTVLSQNPRTGELAYKLVLLINQREPTAMRCLSVGKESITATLGHRFWLIGGGWRMAKHLEADTELCGLSAPLRLDSVEEAEEQGAHSLTVEDFHTYFVGKSRLLVHDNTRPLPVQGAVPGLVSPVDTGASR
jgi:tetratricopeptide (TPR) repeat protein